MTTPTLGSILLGSHDRHRLLDWYCAAFDCVPNEVGFLPFGETDVLIAGQEAN